MPLRGRIASVVLVDFLIMTWASIDEVNVVTLIRLIIILSCNHPYMLELGRVSYGLWEGFCWNENGILRRVGSMLELHLTKATQGSRLVSYLPKYHPYVLTSNDMSEWWELHLKRFNVYGMNCCWWWNLDPWGQL